MKIATLNLRHGGGTRIAALANRLIGFDCDVLVLTEYRNNHHGLLLQALLKDRGYCHFQSASSDAKTNTVAIAARLPFTVSADVQHTADTVERLLLVSFGTLRMVGAYFPLGRHKRPVFEWLLTHGIDWLGDDGILMGDLNTGLHQVDETGRTFVEEENFRRLGSGPLVDGWRSRHQEDRDFSWYSNHGNGFRIDHLFCTPYRYDLLEWIRYDHGPREARESDHSAMVAQFT